ncbi:MAG: hypothetical protein WD872_05535 [Pirellulaceae bacterium]
MKDQRKKRGRICRPLPPRQEGADQSYKEFMLGVLYDEEQKRRYVGATSGDHAVRKLDRYIPAGGQAKVGRVNGSIYRE